MAEDGGGEMTAGKKLSEKMLEVNEKTRVWVRYYAGSVPNSVQELDELIMVLKEIEEGLE